MESYMHRLARPSRRTVSTTNPVRLGAVLCTGAVVALLAVPLPGAPPAQTAVEEMRRAVEAFQHHSNRLGLRAGQERTVAVSRGRLPSWHGHLFWNVRNDVFDAVPHEVVQTGGDKGILRRNQFGFSLSGPVVVPKLYDGRNRTFLTITFEGVREGEGESFLETVATAAERGGDFSRTVDKAGQLLAIHDPDSTRLNPGFDPSQPVSESNLQYRRDPFPGNRIPAARLDPAALEAVRFYPRANIRIGPFDQNNYTIFTPRRNNADGLRARVDHSIGDRHRIAVDFNYSNGFRGPAKLYDSIANPSDVDRGFRERELDIEHTYMLSPSTVNEFDFEVSSSAWEARTEFGDLGSPFPRFEFSPYLDMGREFPVSRTREVDWELEDGITFRRGQHSLRVRGAIWWGRASDFEPEYPAGLFSFGEALTSLPGIVNTGHSFASFQLGLARQAEA
ncbi:MAG: hypothetical protein GY953_54680, partial [bacterium]|nr:hypothetical protein [bacterium]